MNDSGVREEFASGMVRDTSEGKTQWHRVSEGPMLARWAEHLTKGAVKYPDLPSGAANWTLAAGNEEYRRFRESAFRHFMAWFYGARDEDHAAAMFFNINGAEYVMDRLPVKTETQGSIFQNICLYANENGGVCMQSAGHGGRHGRVIKETEFK